MFVNMLRGFGFNIFIKSGFACVEPNLGILTFQVLLLLLLFNYLIIIFFFSESRAPIMKIKAYLKIDCLNLV